MDAGGVHKEGAEDAAPIPKDSQGERRQISHCHRQSTTKAMEEDVTKTLMTWDPLFRLE